LKFRESISKRAEVGFVKFSQKEKEKKNIFISRKAARDVTM
jgi:hypothetical protein